ncbi:hypothetical protein WN55_07310 [Dufourea novaeangliae]|uniref:Histone-lysine N-methyltransferase SETMAR n=1 Tax=Dufourea novaeangliae TaxID=178035 RepID=A0A154P1R0_DUFNO|nr:hypothetical protein WN55_07310 [Dufourea novaeangliae]
MHPARLRNCPRGVMAWPDFLGEQFPLRTGVPPTTFRLDIRDIKRDAYSSSADHTHIRSLAIKSLSSISKRELGFSKHPCNELPDGRSRAERMGEGFRRDLRVICVSEKARERVTDDERLTLCDFPCVLTHANGFLTAYHPATDNKEPLGDSAPSSPNVRQPREARSRGRPHRGDFSLQNALHSCWPREIRNNQVKCTINNNSRYTAREIAEILQLSKSGMENRLHQFGYVSQLKNRANIFADRIDGKIVVEKEGSRSFLR